KSKMTRLKRMFASLHLPAAQRYDAYMRLFDDETVEALWAQSDETRGAARLSSPKSSSAAQWMVHEFEALAQGRDVVQTAMALDRATYLPEDLFTKVDRAAMLHALEVRSPFMDVALVHFAAGLTTDQLFGARAHARAFMQS